MLSFPYNSSNSTKKSQSLSNSILETILLPEVTVSTLFYVHLYIKQSSYVLEPRITSNVNPWFTKSRKIFRTHEQREINDTT